MQTLRIEDFPSPQVARALSPNGRAGYWARVRAKRLVAERVMVELQRQGVQPMHGRVRLTVRWVFPQRRRRDADNHAGGGCVKAAIDVLEQAHIIPADDSDHLELAPVELVVEPGQRRMELRLEAAG